MSFSNTKNICFVCQKNVKICQAYMICKNLNHICHKKCLKQKYKDNNYDEKLDAGYVYSSSTNRYKKHQCHCDCFMTIHNKLSWKLKKVGKYFWIPIIIVLII